MLLCGALFLASCSSANPETDDSPSEAESRLTSRSEVGLSTLGPISIGMTVDQLARAAGVDMVRQPDFEEAMEQDNCAYMSPATIPGYVPPADGDNKSPIAFMIVDDRLARIDFLDRTFTTAEGIGVGSTEVEVLNAYGGGQSPPPDRGFIGKPYRYLKASPETSEGDQEYRIVFESDGAQVVKYYIGKLPEVENKNGCERELNS
ncbi:MAG: hypothetical protein KY393_01235 [Actinobacteria bacterium]|nr:hypothetical protein [Actinomycetota bacterium]